MRRYQALISVIATLVIPIHLFEQKRESGVEKTNAPNVLIINIGDMGYGDMSGHGNPAFKTPALDKLYNQKYASAYVIATFSGRDEKYY